MVNPVSKFILTAENRVSGVLKTVEKDFGGIGRSVNRSMGLLEASMAGLSAVFLARSFISSVDRFRQVDTQLKNATRSTLEFTEAQRRLFDIAQATRQNYATLATSFAQISASAGSSIGTQDQQFKFFETVSKAIALSGASAESASAAMLQFRQGLAAGALRGEELNSVMENTPRLARAIAEGLGVSIGQLREMGKAGELTSERIAEAMDNASKVIDREFANVVPTFDSAMTKMRNSVDRLFDRIEKRTGDSVFELTNLFSWLADKIDEATRDPSLAERVAKQQRRLFDVETGDNPTWSQLQREARERSKMGALNDESRRTFRMMENASSQVIADAVDARDRRAESAWEKLGERYASDAEKKAKIAAEIRQAGKDAGKSEAEILRLVREATSGKGGKKEDPLRDLIEDAEKRNKQLQETLEDRERSEEFFAQLLHDDGVRQAELIADEVERNRDESDAWRERLDFTRKYTNELEKIERLRLIGPNAGGLSESDSALARFLVGNEIDGALAGTSEKAKEAGSAARELGLTFQSAFEDAIIEGKKFSDVLGGIGQDLLRLTIRKSLTEPLADKLSTVLNFGSLFGNRAPITASRPTTVVPNRAMGIDFVPYDNYPAFLHRGEKLLNANTAVKDRGAAPMSFAPQITIQGEMSRTQEARLMAAMRNLAITTFEQQRRRMPV